MFQKVVGSSAKALSAFAFLFAVLPASAQSTIPEPPGIYGGAVEPATGDYRYVEFEGASGDNYTIPLNGILNYVGYYIPSSGAFLPGGQYTVVYLDADKKVVKKVKTVIYSPNSGYTNGVEVTKPNPGADGPLGIQGTVDFEGSPIEGQPVTLLSAGAVIASATTNGDGFFSVYYGTNPDVNTGFIPPGSYTLQIGRPPTCPPPVQSPNVVPVIGSVSLTVNWDPTNTTNPDLPSYYVANAATNVGTIELPFGAATGSIVCPE